MTKPFDLGELFARVRAIDPLGKGGVSQSILELAVIRLNLAEQTDKHSIVALDAKAKTTATWPLSGCEFLQVFAIDRAHGRLFTHATARRWSHRHQSRQIARHSRHWGWP